MLVTAAYVGAIVWAIIALILMIIITDNRKNANYVMLFSITVVVNFGYYFLSASTTVEEAIIATKLTYLNGTFLPLFLIMTVAQICEIKIKRSFIFASLVVDFEILISVFTIGYLPWHYKSATLVREDGFSTLIKEYGPHHTFYIIMMFIYMLAPIVIVAYAYFRRHRVSWIYAILLAVGGSANIVIYFVERLLHLRMDLVPFSISIYELMILLVLRRVALYDVKQNVQLSLSQRNDSGYAILDTQRRFIGADEVARKFFPELNELTIDCEVKQPFLAKEFGRWIKESATHPVEPKFFERFGADVKVMVEPFYSNYSKRQLGFMMQVIDDSVNQRYIRQLEEANEKLAELAREADSANAAKSEFLSLMSHEIRTPINVVLGMNELILKESSDEHISDHAEDIKSAGEILLALVNDILDFSKIESGRMEVVETDYKVENIVHDIRLMARARAKDKPIELSFDIDETLPSKLHGDERKLRQIVINLLTNAIKYTDEGSVKVAVKVKDRRNSKLTIEISVIDTGRGITKANQKVLFDAFTRVDEIKNQGIEGTGLGLAITKSFVSMLGGRIKVQSEYGKGSTFTVTVVQKIVDDKPLEIGKKTSSKNVPEIVYDFSGKRILGVDDVKMSLKLFELFTKETGAAVETVDSGAKALELCSKTKYDLIFLDHMMPEMDGLECIKHIKGDEDSLNKDVPVVIMTANAIAGADAEYRREGFNDYISKPYSSAQLLAMIEKHII